MKEREHKNTLQYIQGVLQHTFGGTPQGKLEVPVNYFIIPISTPKWASTYFKLNTNDILARTKAQLMC